MRLLDEGGMAGWPVAVTTAAWTQLEETARAFDGVATDYDRSNSANQTLCEMRRRTRDALSAYAPAGAAVLDLGCGPGTDLDALARAGFNVTALDWSPGMVAEARRRIARSGIEDRVCVRHLGIQDLAALPREAFDAAYSSLGPMNCVPNLADAARLIGQRLKPGGVFVASVIGRVCPWDLALYAWRRDWARLLVRFGEGLVPVPLSGRTVWTRYHTPADFERSFLDAGFTRLALRALGLLVPPPYLAGFTARHAAIVRTLQALEDRTAHWPVLRGIGDHFLIVMRRT